MQFFKIFWVKLDSLRNSEVNCVPISSDVLNINRYFQPPQKDRMFMQKTNDL